MTALYYPKLVQIVPQVNIGRPTPAANVTHWEAAVAGLTIPQLQSIQNTFDSAWYTFWRSVGATSPSYIGSIVTDMSSDTGLQVTNATYTPQNGILTGGQVADQVAALVSLHTATRYRGGHGRIYLPGIAQSIMNADGRTIQPTTLTSLTNNWNALVTAMAGVTSLNGGPLNPVVWHKKLAGRANTVEIVSSITAQSVIATQRRRVRRVSRH